MLVGPGGTARSSPGRFRQKPARQVSGGSARDSNSPRWFLTPYIGFEDQAGHQHRTRFRGHRRRSHRRGQRLGFQHERGPRPARAGPDVCRHRRWSVRHLPLARAAHRGGRERSVQGIKQSVPLSQRAPPGLQQRRRRRDRAEHGPPPERRMRMAPEQDRNGRAGRAHHTRQERPRAVTDRVAAPTRTGGERPES